MTISISTRFIVLERDRFACRFCGRVRPETGLEVDHLYPRSKGGTDDIANLVTACIDCNRGKSDRVVEMPELAPAEATIVGKCFQMFQHDEEYDRFYVTHQGRIIGALGEGFYAVQFFAYGDGDPTPGFQVFHVQTMAADHGWQFYETKEEMMDSLKWGGMSFKGIPPATWRTPLENRMV